MAQKLSDLQSAGPILPTDLMLIDNGTPQQTRKVTILQLIQTFVGNALQLFTTGANNVTPVVAVYAQNALGTTGFANLDVAIVPKGTGALLGTLPDNLIPGGNKRGTYAVDWQLLRTLALQVAGAPNSAIGGGTQNSIGSTSNYAVVAGGFNNAIPSCQGGFIGGGNGNSISASTVPQYCVIAGGLTNTIFGTQSVIAGGQGNTTGQSANAGISNNSIGGGLNNLADGLYGTIPGGWGATNRTITGVMSYSSGQFAARGDNQIEWGVFKLSTTTATPAGLTTDLSAPNTGNSFVLPNNSSYAFVAQVIARDTATGNTAMWEVRGAVKRGANAAATAVVGSVVYTTTTGTSTTPTQLAGDAGAAAWTIAAAANTSTGALQITGTGAAATTIRWASKIATVEVTN